MILYVITDAPANAKSAGSYNIKNTLEDLAGDWCATIRYDQLDWELLGRLRPWAICHSGGGATYDTYDVLEHPGYRRVIREWPAAQIGFCGGHQIIAHAFGSALGHMRQIRPDEPDLGSAYHPGQYKEWGVYPVRVVKADPLFDGLGEIIRVQEYHMDEVKDLSPELELLASSDGCRVQAFVHKSKYLYGTQFHPEQANESYPDGTRILKNFFALARSHSQ